MYIYLHQNSFLLPEYNKTSRKKPVHKLSVSTLHVERTDDLLNVQGPAQEGLLGTRILLTDKKHLWITQAPNMQSLFSL